jgi:hypothetical protein
VSWQPIETAPRDGTDVLLVWYEKNCMIVAGWDDEQHDEPYRWASLDGPVYHKDAFSHWMPLPEAPE